ncbi:MAG: hypothetical protein R6U63_13010 [Longimicrobiales bacterium]
MSALPALDRPLGSVEFRLRVAGAPDEAPWRVGGRRAFVTGTGADGIDALWMHPVLVARGLRVRGAVGRAVLETPLGVERRLAVVGEGAVGEEVIERVVVSRDAPVVWVEYRHGATEDTADTEDTEDTEQRLQLEWRVGLEAQEDAAGSPEAPLEWERRDRGLVVTGGVAAFRAVFVFSAAPEALEVERGGAGSAVPDGSGGLVVRARLPVGADGLRLAVVGAGPDDHLDRLLRIAGRTRVAVRAREGAANRVLAEGLTVASPDADLDRAVARTRVHLDATRIETAPGGWRIDPAAREALGRLAAGDFGPVRGFLRLLARGVTDDGRVPSRGVGGGSPGWDDPRAGPLFLLLTARYLAWSGDRPGVEGVWGAVERVVAACREANDDAAPALRPAAFRALAVAAEEIGEDAMARGLREAAGPDGPGAPDGPGVSFGPGERGDLDGPGRPVNSPALTDGDPDPWDPAAAVRRVVFGLLGADPDAPRGRLVLRPRPPAGWDRLQVEGLAVGSAAVDVAYEAAAGEAAARGTPGGLRRLTLRQTRGAAPLQVVLEPELGAGRVMATRVDGEAADLDVAAVGDRWRVPVQVVLHAPRSLEVEITGESR